MLLGTRPLGAISVYGAALRLKEILRSAVALWLGGRKSVGAAL
jgi:hypothetical protein